MKNTAAVSTSHEGETDLDLLKNKNAAAAPSSGRNDYLAPSAHHTADTTRN